MAGTTEGGKSAAKTNLEKYGTDFYKNIGRKGGSVKHFATRYFYTNREAARTSGAKGGTISRRGKSK